VPAGLRRHDIRTTLDQPENYRNHLKRLIFACVVGNLSGTSIILFLVDTRHRKNVLWNEIAMEDDGVIEGTMMGWAYEEGLEGAVRREINGRALPKIPVILMDWVIIDKK
jgi:hypothetical protein